MNPIRFAFLVLLTALCWGVPSRAADTPTSTRSPTILVDMFGWWNGIINSEEPLTADQFRRYFTEDGVIVVNGIEQVRGVEHMPAHFQAIRERPGTIAIELPFIEEFQSGNKIFTHHTIRSIQPDGVTVTHNMGYAIIEGDKIVSISLARYQEQPQE